MIDLDLAQHLTTVNPDTLAMLVITEGGFTVSTITGWAPTDGYAVSVPNFESTTTLAQGAEHLAHDVARYLARHADTLALPGIFLGAWHDTTTGAVYLDHTMVTDTRADAARRAVTYQQAAYFDLATGVETRVDADLPRR